MLGFRSCRTYLIWNKLYELPELFEMLQIISVTHVKNDEKSSFKIVLKILQQSYGQSFHHCTIFFVAVCMIHSKMNLIPVEYSRYMNLHYNGKEIMEKKVRYTIFTTTFYLCHDGGDSTPFGRKNFSWIVVYIHCPGPWGN